MAGGAVKGGQILGDYPSLGEDSDVNLGRGRLLPTTGWEQVRSDSRMASALIRP